MGDLMKTESTALGAEHQQYLTFLVGSEMFAIGILNIREIIEYEGMTSVPMMPAFVRGVLNLRGAVVPVIDLAARFGRKPCEAGKRTCIVIVEVEGEEAVHHQLGLVVDSVSEVLEIQPADIESPPAFGAKIRADFISGMGKVASKFVILLNVNKVLAVEEMADLVSTTAGGGEEV